MKTNAMVNTTLSEVPADGETTSPAQQVEKIKADLEARHADRVRQLEEDYKKRTDGMRAQLTQKLKESREQARVQARHQVESEHGEAMERLRTTHLEEIQSLTVRHLEELERLKTSATAEQQTSKVDVTETVKPDATLPGPAATGPAAPVTEWNLSDAQARELLGCNVTLKSIMRSNLSTQLKRMREEQENSAKEKLREAQVKAEKDREQAVAMAEQRQKVKLSMAEGKARSFGVKVEIVQKAATETPQRPVGEVWEIAKAMKPAPVTMPGGAQANKNIPSPTTAVPSAAVGGVPAPAVGPLRHSTPPMQASIPSPVSTNVAEPSADTGVASVGASPTTNTAARATQAASPTAPPSSLPAKPSPGQQPAVGTGPAALKGIVGSGQSSIPRGGATNARGGRGARGGIAGPGHANLPNQAQRGGIQSNLPRGGRGRGQAGRGSGPVTQTAGLPPAAGQGPNSPGGRGALNASARQFVPGGNKRAREDGPDEAGGAGKRVRGGGPAG